MFVLFVSSLLLSSVSLCLSANPGTHYLTPKEFASDQNFTECYASTDGDSIFRYSVPNLNKSLPDVTFSKLKAKAILVLNVATFCRSATDYPQLNQLIEKFGDKLKVVGFPSAQFWNQEPGTPEEIFNSIRYVRPGKGFVPKFTLTEKVEVNGAAAHPVFSFLKRSCPSTETRFTDQKFLFWDPKNERDLKWNFEKFLIDGKSGQPVRRYDTNYDAIKISADIEKLVNKA